MRPRIGQAFYLLLLWMGVQFAAGPLPLADPAAAPFPGSSPPADQLNSVLMLHAFLAATVVRMAAARRRMTGLGLGPPLRGTWRLLLAPALLAVALVAGAIALGPPPWPVAVLLVINVLIIAWSEELMFRGVLYAGLRDRFRPWPAVLLASALFGAVHLGNGPLPSAASQGCAAAVLGVLLLALRLRTGSLWGPVLFHAAWNLSVLLPASAMGERPADASVWPNLVGPVLVVLPLGLYGTWLLRRLHRTGDGLPPPQPWGAAHGPA